MSKYIFRFPDKTADVMADTMSKIRVAVVPVSDGAGASYVSSVVLQKGLLSGDTPEGLRSLVELGRPYFYFALGMDKRFSGRDFFCFEKPEIYKTNMELGYNWYLRLPSANDALPLGSLFRALSSAPGSLVVYDCSGLQKMEYLPQILSEMDYIYLVVDPLPSRLMKGQQTLDEIRGMFPKAKIVVNKYNSGIHKGELKRFLGTSNYYTLEAISYDKICRAEFNCNLI